MGGGDVYGVVVGSEWVNGMRCSGQKMLVGDWESSEV